MERQGSSYSDMELDRDVGKVEIMRWSAHAGHSGIGPAIPRY